MRHGLGERLRSAERCCKDLDRQIKGGDLLIKRLSRIVAAARPDESMAEQAALIETEPEVEPVDPPTVEPRAVPKVDPAPDARAVAAAAQAFAARARTRLNSLAA